MHVVSTVLYVRIKILGASSMSVLQTNCTNSIDVYSAKTKKEFISQYASHK